MSSGYPEFRRRLDALLRQRDPQALRAFLIAAGQWEATTTTDPERAMWMMIATSPTLAAQRDEAIAWLAAHGYAEEARTLGGGSGQRGAGASGGRPPDGRGGHPPGAPHRPPNRSGKPGGPPRHPPRPGNLPRRDG